MDLLKEFSQYLRQALEGMTGQAPELDIRTTSTHDESPDAVFWWEQPLDLSPGATIWIGASEAAWSGIGGQVLAAAGVEDASVPDRRSTYIEVLQQALSPVARAIGHSLGRDVVCQPGRETEAAPEHAVSEIVVRHPGQAPRKLWISFAPGLVAVLSGEAAATPGATGASPVASSPTPDLVAPEGPSRTLDVLLEVELPVSISFGRAHVPLKDVLKLTSGSIVELNRGIQEPVEVIVNNCVIARGEVVVVEGNYGVKINQIVSRQERLRSLY